MPTAPRRSDSLGRFLFWGVILLLPDGLGVPFAAEKKGGWYPLRTVLSLQALALRGLAVANQETLVKFQRWLTLNGDALGWRVTSSPGICAEYPQSRFSLGPAL
ncbi:MAG: hypothetical protein AAGA46_03255 [Cyanobacteria bacterium P01_F01_bin.13]